MKKSLFIFFTVFSISQLHAVTLVLFYPPSLNQLTSGKFTAFNSSRDASLDAITDELLLNDYNYTMFTFPVEIRKTILEFKTLDIMAVGGLSLVFENRSFSSVNLTLGVNFGGYNRDKHILPPLSMTLYPLYEFPLAILWKNFKWPWKFACDISLEIIRAGPVSVNLYVKIVGFLTPETASGAMFFPGAGISIGWIF